MDRDQFRKIKKLTIIALFSDNDLLDMLVLKGGTALEFYDIDHRLSLDLDFSIDQEFKEHLDIIKKKIEATLQATFQEAGYMVFDIKFRERPKRISDDLVDFWGGYLLEFKVIEIDKYKQLSSDIDSMRRNATVVGPLNRKIFSVEISKYEYCELKQQDEVDGYTIFIYSPSMLVCEKLRAICQQMAEYAVIVRSSSQTARAKDFYDIFILIEKYNIDLTSDEILYLLQKIFGAKRVPLSLIDKIQEYREFHRENFLAVKATVGHDVQIENYDFYFDYVVYQCKSISKTLGIE